VTDLQVKLDDVLKAAKVTIIDALRISCIVNLDLLAGWGSQDRTVEGDDSGNLENTPLCKSKMVWQGNIS
jgi:hypothetical protein